MAFERKGEKTNKQMNSTEAEVLQKADVSKKKVTAVTPSYGTMKDLKRKWFDSKLSSKKHTAAS